MECNGVHSTGMCTAGEAFLLNNGQSVQTLLCCFRMVAFLWLPCAAYSCLVLPMVTFSCLVLPATAY
jgi:hypothetical protein